MTTRDKAFYKYWLDIQSRWSDNDQYGHINNSIFYLYIDTIVNEYLIAHCGLKPTQETGPIGLVVSSSANFHASVEYPTPLRVGLSVTKIGTSSVRYQVGIFARKPQGAWGSLEGEEKMEGAVEDEAAVTGGFVHVFCDKVTRRPMKALPSDMKTGLQRIQVELPAESRL